MRGAIVMNDKTAPISNLITPEVAKAYLINVAETLNNIVIPQLEGSTRSRAHDCLRVVSRLVSDSQLSINTKQLLEPLAANPIAAALQHGVAIESANAEGEAFLQSVKNSQPVAARSFDHYALENFLRTHPLGGANLRVTHSRLLAGGRSKITVLISQQGGHDLPEDFVLRQDWANSPTGKAVAIEFELLKRLYDAGIKVPQPLLLERSKEIAGNPFMLVSRRPGAPSGDHFMSLPPSERPILQLAEQLGRLHGLDAALFEGLEGIVESNYTSEQLRSAIASYSATIAELDTANSPLLEQAMTWLVLNIERVCAAPRTLVHGDFGFHNSLVDGDDLSVILDWEMVHLGNPAYDLGYLRHAIRDDELWARFMKHYRNSGGPNIPEDFIDYYTVLTGIWYHQIQLQVRSALMAGVIHDMEITALCADFAPAVLASISRTLRRVTEQ
jgi:aminoglycoside phosphotransferase (APT) family kinase protein